MSSISYDSYRSAPRRYIELGSVDEGESYEVDVTQIYYDKLDKMFVLITASGCSCWDGDCDEEKFKTLEELEKSLVTDDRTYNPTLMGAKELIKEAKEKWTELATKQ